MIDLSARNTTDVLLRVGLAGGVLSFPFSFMILAISAPAESGPFLRFIWFILATTGSVISPFIVVFFSKKISDKLLANDRKVQAVAFCFLSVAFCLFSTVLFAAILGRLSIFFV